VAAHLLAVSDVEGVHAAHEGHKCPRLGDSLHYGAAARGLNKWPTVTPPACWM